MDVDAAGRLLQADIGHLIESGVATAGGWRGLSSAALTAKSDEWLVRGNTLLVRVGEHAQVFHTSASTFTEMTHRHVATLDAVAEQSRQVSASSGFDPQDL